MPNEPFCIVVRLRVRAGEEAATSAHLRALVRETRREPGNLIYNAHRSIAQPEWFYIYELYRDEAALDAHRATPHYIAHAAEGLYPVVEERIVERYAPVKIG